MFELRLTGNPNDCFTITFGGTNFVFNDQNEYGLLTSSLPITNLCLSGGKALSGNIKSNNFCIGTLNHGVAGVDVPVRTFGTGIPVQGSGDLLCSNISNLYGQHNCTICPTTNYYLWPEKDENMACGVDEFDFAEIVNHILGKKLFTTIDQLVAADVNFDQHVTTGDLIIINKMILGLPVSPVKSWRFIDINQYIILDHPYDPGTLVPLIKQYIANTDAQYFPNQMSFKGIKSGDVNFSCLECGNTLNGENETREGILAHGKILKISEDLQSARYTIEIDKLKDLDIASLSFQFNEVDYELPSIKALNSNKTYTLFPGLNGHDFHIAIQFTNTTNENASNSFELVFNKKSNVVDKLGLIQNKSKRNKVLYNNQTQIDDIEFDNPVTDISNQVINIYPNPTVNEFNIDLFTTESTDYIISIADLKGNTLFKNIQRFDIGWNKFECSALANLPAGMYIIQILSDHTLETKTIVKSK